jgi:hypothetical protein
MDFSEISTEDSGQMHIYVRHIFLPVMAPALLVGLYFTPVALVGCVNRGLMALAVVLISAVAAFVTVGIAIRLGMKKDSSSRWWILSPRPDPGTAGVTPQETNSTMIS